MLWTIMERDEGKEKQKVIRNITHCPSLIAAESKQQNEVPIFGL
jgi:hypothetical protein